MTSNEISANNGINIVQQQPLSSFDALNNTNDAEHAIPYSTDDVGDTIATTTKESSSSSSSPPLSMYSRRYKRHLVIGLVILTAVVFLFAFLVAGAVQNNNNNAKKKKNAADSLEGNGGGGGGGGGVAIVNDGATATVKPPSLLRSTASPSSSPANNPLPSLQLNLNLSEESGEVVSTSQMTTPSTFMNVSNWVDYFTGGEAAPTKSPSTKPSAEQPTKVPTNEPSTRPTAAPSKSSFIIDVESWIAAFTSLEVSEEEEPSITATASDTTTTTTLSTTTTPGYTCMTQEACDEMRQTMGFEYYLVGPHGMKGCFYKNAVAYFGEGGVTEEEMGSASVGQKIRIWCDEPASTTTTATATTISTTSSSVPNVVGEIPSDVDIISPTQKPSPAPTTAKPTTTPTKTPEKCFTVNTYESIDSDIARMKQTMFDPKSRSHFIGGIVRLAAHDFMDYDGDNTTHPFGPDGCFDPTHKANAGLPEEIWCSTCALTLLYEEKYNHLMSRADFWVACANSIIRQTSVNNTLDLRSTFVWGRKDADSCHGSGDRVPSPEGCGSVEHTFIMKMGLTWKDAVALMGAHTLGRGDAQFSGHHGTWVDTDEDSERFDKQYYEEIYLNSWRPRDNGPDTNSDWTTGRPGDVGNTRVMLNTDMCLVFDIDDIDERKCCSRTGWDYPDGTDRCIDNEAARRRCPMYEQTHSRWESVEAVGEMLGGAYPNTNNQPFYNAFAEAWRKATTVGQTNLSPLLESCEST